MADETWEVKENAYVYCAPVPFVPLAIDDGSDTDSCPYLGWTNTPDDFHWATRKSCTDGWVSIPLTDGIFDERRFVKNYGAVDLVGGCSGHTLTYFYAPS